MTESQSRVDPNVHGLRFVLRDLPDEAGFRQSFVDDRDLVARLFPLSRQRLDDYLLGTESILAFAVFGGETGLYYQGGNSAGPNQIGPEPIYGPRVARLSYASPLEIVYVAGSAISIGAVVTGQVLNLFSRYQNALRSRNVRLRDDEDTATYQVANEVLRDFLQDHNVPRGRRMQLAKEWVMDEQRAVTTLRALDNVDIVPLALPPAAPGTSQSGLI